ncbi:FAD-dependent oxidoreductase [Bacillus sp. Marseille-P3661]|uniref:FAD-dependent oxidoreductase n=1 Tax=Bacillus sp. Marseille-P3661 TaxID=1936234 RepID=UPI000C857F18|nr:FAD-dependent oxidoreductase [Bacillus sp. Marseille-P3661]
MKKLIISVGILIFLIGIGYALMKGMEYYKNPDVAAKDKIDPSFFENENDIQSFDVIVIGDDPEAVAAALSAAKTGAHTLLVSARDGLGGLFTYGKMNVLDFPHGINNVILSSGTFEEWHDLVGNGQSFEIEKANNAFLNLVYRQDNLSLLLNTSVSSVVKDGSHEISSLKLTKENKQYTVVAKKYIDATQDADLAVQSGVPYFIGAEDVGQAGRLMAVTLMIHFSDVDWSKIKQVAKEETFGTAEVTNEAAWGFVGIRETYKPKDPNMRLRGFNLIRNDEGYYINALQIFGVDALDPQSRQEGIERGKEETKHILAWLKENFPGFENAKIASYPEDLYVRETRHIYSLYQLPVSDLWENKYHWDTIAYGGYPSDIQATSVDDPGAVVVNPTQYGIPFRSLVPQNIKNLLVVGRSGGYSSLAQGSVRIVPTGMATGDAAGVASAFSITKNIDFHQLAQDKGAIAELQALMEQQGLEVAEFDVPYPYEDKWYYPAIRELLNHRAVFGGYTNDISIEKVASNKSLSNLLLYPYRVLQMKNPKYAENAQYLSEYFVEKETVDLTVDETVKIIEGLPYKDFDNSYLEELKKWDPAKPLTREMIYIIAGKIFGWI